MTRSATVKGHVWSRGSGGGSSSGGGEEYYSTEAQQDDAFEGSAESPMEPLVEEYRERSFSQDGSMKHAGMSNLDTDEAAAREEGGKEMGWLRAGCGGGKKTDSEGRKIGKDDDSEIEVVVEEIDMKTVGGDRSGRETYASSKCGVVYKVEDETGAESVGTMERVIAANADLQKLDLGRATSDLPFKVSHSSIYLRLFAVDFLLLFIVYSLF